MAEPAFTPAEIADALTTLRLGADAGELVQALRVSAGRTADEVARGRMLRGVAALEFAVAVRNAMDDVHLEAPQGQP